MISRSFWRRCTGGGRAWRAFTQTWHLESVAVGYSSHTLWGAIYRHARQVVRNLPGAYCGDILAQHVREAAQEVLRKAPPRGYECPCSREAPGEEQLECGIGVLAALACNSQQAKSRLVICCLSRHCLSVLWYGVSCPCFLLGNSFQRGMEWVPRLLFDNSFQRQLDRKTNVVKKPGQGRWGRQETTGRRLLMTLPLINPAAVGQKPMQMAFPLQ